MFHSQVVDLTANAPYGCKPPINAVDYRRVC